ncbi:MAG: ligase-associated DNA damage response endonuclease PdeM [Proteobacteria bacterium]|nr:ligase-associated DNA damage response endonuclease PdeM [Pseudomonadota bacterium]
MRIEAGGEALLLLPQRAVYLPLHRSLLVADAHIGKAQSFRRLGVPVPAGTTAGTLARLDEALQATAAERVIFLGDLLHSARGRGAETLAAVQRWRAAHLQLDCLLLRGNHDRHAGDPPADWRVRVADEPFMLGGLALRHHPEAQDGAYVLAGHVHPCVVLGGRAHDRLRLPCFHFGPAVGVLPAFGEFTGMHALRRGDGERVFVVRGHEVLAVPG